MQNPMLTQLNASNPATRRPNDLLRRLGEVKQLVSGQNPTLIYNRMLQSNPEFAAFVQRNQGKSPEQIAQEYGVDFSAIRDLLR